MGAIHPHKHDPDEAEDSTSASEETDAIATAILQGMYFETPSYGVREIREHRYSPDARGWKAKQWNQDDREMFGIDCDMTILEVNPWPRASQDPPHLQ